MNKHLKSLKVLALSVAMLFTTGAAAQDREYISNKIEEWEECRSVAITETNGDIAIHGQNGCAFINLPESMEKTLAELNDKEVYIEDIQLTEAGNWLIVFEGNGLRWSGIPKDFENMLREFNKNKEVITSASFNDAGDWVIVTEKRIAASDGEIYEWLQETSKQHGELWTANLNESGIIAIFENGFASMGEIPEELQQSLEKTELDVYRAKFCGDSWFFADKEGSCEWHF